ncbi:extracellular substrate-binding protein [Bordetella trematum]|nr:extracellular substrate-binding protein [Bordetella trematum]
MTTSPLSTRRRLLQAGAATGLGAILATGSAPAVARGKVRWRLGMAWARNAPGYTTPVVALAEFLSKASGGDFELELFGAGEVVPPLQTFDAVLDGTLDCGHGYPSYWAGKSIAMNLAMSMPFGTTAQEKNAWLQYGGGQEVLDKVYERFGAKFFPLGNCGVQPMGWFRNPIHSPDDLRGLKFRVTGLAGQVLRECGVAVVTMPVGELLQAMQSGAVDACELTGPYIDTTMGIQRAAKNYYFPAGTNPRASSICSSTWTPGTSCHPVIRNWYAWAATMPTRSCSTNWWPATDRPSRPCAKSTACSRAYCPMQCWTGSTW